MMPAGYIADLRWRVIWFVHILQNSVAEASSFLSVCERTVQGVKLTFFPGSHLAPKCFKVVANSKKLVAMTHTKPFLPCR